MLALLLLGCPHPSAPPPAPAPTGSPAHEACVEDCWQHRQMVAMSVDAIRAKCSDDCDAAHDPASLFPPQ